MRPLIIAHRGASHLAPENTLTAFRLAKTLGADGFECDVQITRDRHLVVAHDYLTDLKTGVHGNIPDMDFDDLRQLDFGKWKSPEFAGEKIPTLEEVLEVAQDFRMIHIELKPYFDRDEEIVDRVIDYIKSTGLNYQVGPFETTIEGESYDQLMDIVKECQHVAVRAGAPKVSAYVKVVYRPDGEILTIDQKIGKYQRS